MRRSLLDSYLNEHGVLTADMFQLAIMHHMRHSEGYSAGYGDCYFKHYAQRMGITVDDARALAFGRLKPSKRILEDMGLREYYCECGSMDDVFYKRIWS